MTPDSPRDRPDPTQPKATPDNAHNPLPPMPAQQDNAREPAPQAENEADLEREQPGNWR